MADVSSWYPVQTILDGLRSVNVTIEEILLTARSGGLAPGEAVYLDTSGTGLTTDSLAIALSRDGGQYEYLLEVWSYNGNEYEKGIEFRYNDELTGELVIRPSLFNSFLYPDTGHYVRASYNHYNDARTMVVDVVQTAVPSPEKARYFVASENGITSVYFTANTRATDIDNSGINDAYLLGAFISESYPYYTVASYGLADIGESYGFTRFGEANEDNAGFFNLVEGFVVDGRGTSMENYPDPGDILPESLPAADIVDNIGISFSSLEAPQF